MALLGNLLFPLIAFAGLFFLFRGAGGQGGQASAPVVVIAAVWLHLLLFFHLLMYSATLTG